MAAHPHDDQIGKVFVAVGRDIRQCLVCEELFTPRAAREHAKIACRPHDRCREVVWVRIAESGGKNSVENTQALHP